MLDEIVAARRKDVEEARRRLPLDALLRGLPTEPGPSFSAVLRRTGVNIIAEIKYGSPSRGAFRCRKPPEEVASLYCRNGAAALSVLTEKRYFQGDLEYLGRIRRLPESEGVPLLRKDFIVDPYQVVETRHAGASAYLLIAACLSPGALRGLLEAGREHGLEALVEVHDAFELEGALEGGARLIGVNNRNLKTLRVDLETSFELARRAGCREGVLLVAESGIRRHQEILELRDAGYSAFLIGSVLMDSPDPGAKLRELRGENP